jgi:type II secretory ATPase GspE/PulE/Tfp pilus assembly ATPase PilB-like protein
MTKHEDEIQLFKGKGCDQCGQSGYFGRIGIFEVMPISDKIAKLILERADSLSIEKEAVAEGMITMKQDGYLKVLDGLTTVDEILRVAQE